jgi:hypothetical protein
MVMQPAGASHPQLRVRAARPLCYIPGMHVFRRQLQRLAWIALVAVFGLALAPTLSHALHANDRANPFAEICSAAGAKPAQAPPGDMLSTPGQHLAHCPLCAQAGGAPGMPSARTAFAPPGTISAALPPAGAWAVPATRSLTPALPRGPPVLS